VRPNTGMEPTLLRGLKIAGISLSGSMLTPVPAYGGGAAHAQAVGPQSIRKGVSQCYEYLQHILPFPSSLTHLNEDAYGPARYSIA
jgi:hypothetical protein